MFATQIDAKELDLIERVAKKVSPIHFYDGGPPVQQAVNDSGRERAREIAQEIIKTVRAADLRKETA